MDYVEHKVCAKEEYPGADNVGQDDPVFLKMMIEEQSTAKQDVLDLGIAVESLHPLEVPWVREIDQRR